MKTKNERILEYYSNLEAKQVDWLWFPYIPFGKLTILQGDPGDGKSSFILKVISHLTRGVILPGSKEQAVMSCLYQNAEDGLSDTIKPRLEQAGADCTKVAFLDDTIKQLTLSDEAIEQAIIKTGARLLVLDPLQAYMGNIDMNRANEVRPLMKNLADIAERTKCAIVLVGHMNKSNSGKNLYRGLGSIDLTAAARSVLLIGRIKDNANLRAVAQVKSNLAMEGKPIVFQLAEGIINWVEDYEITVEELFEEPNESGTKLELAVKYIKAQIEKGRNTSDEVYSYCLNLGISRRTIEAAKQILGVVSKRKQQKWYWELPLLGGANE